MTIRHYRFCGKILESSLPLSELSPGRGKARWSVSFETTARPAGRPPKWHTRWTMPGGKSWLSIASDAKGHCLRFSTLADFRVSADCSKIVCSPFARLPEATLRHLLLDQVLPLLVSVDGQLVLHASAVSRGGQAIGFVGRTGRGKSTLCAALLRRRSRLVCDDSLVLSAARGTIAVTPSYSDIRLWPDTAGLLNGRRARVAHYSEKVRLRQQPARTRLTLARLFLLGAEAKQPSATLLSPRQAIASLLPHVFRLTPNDAQYMQREFKFLADLVRRVPVYRLSYPRRINSLNDVCEVVEGV